MLKIELAVGFLNGQWRSADVDATAEEFEHADEGMWIGKLMKAGYIGPGDDVSFVHVLRGYEEDADGTD